MSDTHPQRSRSKRGPGEVNPYTPPEADQSTDLDAAAIRRLPPTQFWVLGSFGIPVVLSQAVFWAGFVISRLWLKPDAYAIGQAFVGLVTCVVGGMIYGALLGRYARIKWPLTSSALPIALAFVHALWFPVLAVGGCLGIAILAG